jgi:hypothetical protein
VDVTREGWGFLSLWVTAVMAGGVLAAVIGLAFVPILDDQVRLRATSLEALNSGYLAAKVTIVLASAVAIAGPSAIVLGRKLRRIGIPWIAASAVAALVSFAIPVTSWLLNGRDYLMQAPAQPSLLIVPFVSGVVAGCVFGLAQAIVLRPYIRGAAWWIPAVIGARSVGNVATAVVSWQISGAGLLVTTSIDYYAGAIAGALVGWLIVGLVTGWVLVRLLDGLDPERTAAAT